MTNHFYELYTDDTHKFWEATVEGCKVTTSYGKWFSNGTTREKVHSDEVKAEAAVAKAIKGKLKDGYLLSDRAFPLHLKAEIERARSSKARSVSFTCTSQAVAEEVCTLTDVTRLTLRGISAVPEQIAAMVHLEALDVSKNDLTELPESLGSLPRLRRIRIYSNKLTTLPASIGHLTKLEMISAWGNQLEELPESFGNLAALTELDLHDNPSLTALPNSFGDLAALNELDLGETAVATLPDSFAKLTLGTLSFEGTALAGFPPALASCSSLETLNLSGCSLATIEEDLSALTNLKVLNLDSSWQGENMLTALPKSLAGLPALENLSVENNQITQVPAWLAEMPALIDLNLSENPIENVPEEVVDAGKDAIFAHLGLTTQAVAEAAPANAAELARAREPQLDAWRRDVKDRSYDDLLDDVLAFLRGETDILPPARPSSHYALDNLCALVLAPRDHWNFIDRRIMQFVTGDAWYFKQNSYHSGYYEDYFAWSKTALASGTEFEQLAADLSERGFDDAQIAAWGMEELAEVVFDGNAPSSFGRWLLALWPDHAAHLVGIGSVWWKMRAALTRLAVGQAGFDDYLPTLLRYTEREAVVSAPTAEIAALVRADAARYRHTLDEALSRATHPDSLASLSILLVEVYNEEPFPLVEQTLVAMSGRLNSEDYYTPVRTDDGRHYVDWVLETFGAHAGPAVFRFVADTSRMDLEVVSVVVRHLGQDALNVALEALKMTITGPELADHFREAFAILAPLDWSSAHDIAWNLAGSEHLAIREVAAEALARTADPGVLTQAEALLTAKAAVSRHGAARVLAEAGRLAPLQSRLELEKDDSTRDAMLAALLVEGPISIAEAQRRVDAAAKRGKLKRPVKKWIDEAALPPLSWNGTNLTPLETRFLFYRQNRLSDCGIDLEIRDILPLLEGGPAFAAALWKLVETHGGAYAKNRFALSLLGPLADGTVVAPLEQLALTKKNENAIKTLGMINDEAALRALLGICRAYETKYPNLRALAEAGLEASAARRGTTVEELADQVVPDLGFVQRERVIGATVLTVLPTGKLQFTTAGKVTKSAPKTMSPAEKASIKDLTKQLRVERNRELERLQEAMITGRSWEPTTWSTHFLGNAVLHSLAHGLVWCSGDLRFRLDGQHLRDVHGAAVSPSLPIRLLHATESTVAEKDAWQAVFTQSKTVAPFSQLDRAVHAPVDPSARHVDDFEGKTVGSSAFAAWANGRRWRRGSVVDAGQVSSYRKAFRSAGIDVFLLGIQGLSVRSDWDEEVTLGRLAFVSAGSVNTGSYTYDEPRTKDDPRLISLGDVPPIVFSEAVSDLVGL